MLSFYFNKALFIIKKCRIPARQVPITITTYWIPGKERFLRQGRFHIAIVTHVAEPGAIDIFKPDLAAIPGSGGAATMHGLPCFEKAKSEPPVLPCGIGGPIIAVKRDTSRLSKVSNYG
jgi:hypothetical protein